MRLPKRAAPILSAVVTAALVALFASATLAVEGGDVTSQDRDFMRSERLRLRDSPEFRRMMRDVQKIEATLKGERKVPYDPNVHTLRLRQPALPLTINPAIRRAMQPSVAIIAFDVTGSGRVVGLELIAAGPHRVWGKDALEMVTDWVFEPLVEGDVGVTRVGITAAVYAELQGAGKMCGTLKSRMAVDFEERACARIKAEF
jgi:hypothetical protein